MESFVKFCPICKNKNDRDAIVCVHCGASLETYFGDETGTTRLTDIQARGTDKLGTLPLDAASVPPGGIAIYVEGTTDYVFMCSEEEFVIGRKTTDTSGAFIDLTKLGAYHLGLSRRHALIRRTDHGYEVMDLASSNGTWLNNEHLEPNRPYPLASGAQLRLARMHFYILYHFVEEVH